MRNSAKIQNWFIALSLSIIVTAMSRGAESESNLIIRFQSFTIPNGSQIRVSAVGRALDFQNWPKTNERRVSPEITKNLLSTPKLVTRENISYGVVDFGGEPWGLGKWSWGRLVENDKLLPTELPTKRKKRLLANISQEERDDPNFVKRYLKGKVDRHAESLKYRLEGEVFVEVCVAPSSQAAQEYLLSALTTNNMMTEGLVSMYADAKQPEGLGTIGFSTASVVSFVRDNVYVSTRANGCFEDEALLLAQKIDSMLTAQTPLTYQQLVSRRPYLTMAPDIDEHRTAGRRTISCNIHEPSMENIVSLRASTVEGQYEELKKGKISLPEIDRPITVKLIAITEELLVNTIEKEIELHN